MTRRIQPISEGHLAARERRERIATAALTGLLAFPSGSSGEPENFAAYAVACADALIAELDKVRP